MSAKLTCQVTKSPPNPSKKVCPSCGTSFTHWRKKTYCSDPCKRKAQNARAYDRAKGTEKEAESNHQGTTLALRKITPRKAPENMGSKSRFSTYETPVFRKLDKWTWKATIRGGEETVAWLMEVEGYGWFAKRKGEGSEWTYGPATLEEAKEAVKDFLRTGDSYDWLIGSIYTGNGHLNRYAVPPSLG